MAAALLWGYNVGLDIGLKSKPVLDLSACTTVTKYEDGSFVCDPDRPEVETPSIPVMENQQMQDSPNTVQNTQPASTLQPAGKD